MKAQLELHLKTHIQEGARVGVTLFNEVKREKSFYFGTALSKTEAIQFFGASESALERSTVIKIDREPGKAQPEGLLSELWLIKNDALKIIH